MFALSRCCTWRAFPVAAQRGFALLAPQHKPVIGGRWFTTEAAPEKAATEAEKSASKEADKPKEVSSEAKQELPKEVTLADLYKKMDAMTKALANLTKELKEKKPREHKPKNPFDELDAEFDKPFTPKGRGPGGKPGGRPFDKGPSDFDEFDKPPRKPIGEKGGRPPRKEFDEFDADLDAPPPRQRRDKPSFDDFDDDFGESARPPRGDGGRGRPFRGGGGRGEGGFGRGRGPPRGGRGPRPPRDF